MNHPDASELLPWHLNGTLDDSERGDVSAHLAECADCRRDLERLEALRKELLHSQDDVPLPAPLFFERVLARTAATGGASTRATSRFSFGWKALPPFARLALAAQFLLIVGLAAFLLLRPRGNETTTMSTGGAASGGSRILIGFQPDATEAAIRETLVAIGANIVSGPDPDGLYVVETPLPEGRAESLERLLAQLRQKSRVVRRAEKAR
jgi:hypothetical protein